tara:strand:- start:232 stop:882 length:651 start_codon:yes stop_codon:yes gene_type:complete
MSNASFRPLEDGLGRMGSEAIDNFIADLFSSDVSVRFPPGEAFAENAKISNSILLGSGEHEGFTASKPHTVISGESGCIVNRLAVIKNHAVVSNIHFKQTADPTNLNHLVRLIPNVDATAAKPIRVLFRQCVFERMYNAPVGIGATNTKAFVVVNALAKAVFTGCVFRSNRPDGIMNGTGTAVQNLNVAATDVYVTSGVNLSTHTHNNVTVIGPEI